MYINSPTQGRFRFASSIIDFKITSPKLTYLEIHVIYSAYFDSMTHVPQAREFFFPFCSFREPISIKQIRK